MSLFMYSVSGEEILRLLLFKSLYKFIHCQVKEKVVQTKISFNRV